MNTNNTILNVKNMLGLGVFGTILLLTIILLGYFGVWGYQTNNIKALSILIIFGFLLIIPIILMIILAVYGLIKSETTNSFRDNWHAPAFGLIIGFIIQAFIFKFSSKYNFSLLSIEKNNLFTTLLTQMPQLGEFATTALMVPVIEELFFVYFIPQSIFLIFGSIKKLDNKYYKFIAALTAMIITSILFAVFHVGMQTDISFLISAIIFRSVMIMIFWGDYIYDFVWFSKVFITACFGFHIGNNWMTYGLANGFGILATSIWGWILIGIIGIFIIFAIDYLFDLFNNWLDNNIASGTITLIIIIGLSVLWWFI